MKSGYLRVSPIRSIFQTKTTTRATIFQRATTTRVTISHTRTSGCTAFYSLISSGKIMEEC